MSEVQTVLLSMLSQSLFNKVSFFNEADWVQLLTEADGQAVTQLIYSVIDVNKLSEEEAIRWKERSSAHLANNIRIIHNHALVHEWMTDADIPYVILKGCASASYYPNPVYRSMGDVDFLVPTVMLEKAGKVLESNGLKPWEEEHISHIVYRKKGMHLEMHFNVAGMPEGKAGELVREYLSDVFEKAELHELGNGKIMLPSAFHHGLIILLHTCHHMTGEGVGLRHLCDWAVFVNGFSDEEFCEMFEDKLKAIGLWKFAQVLTYVSSKYLGADQKIWALCDDELADELIEDILTGGNFGKKETGRSLQTMLISDRGKNGVGNTGMGTQFVQSINNLVVHHWPKAKNNPALLTAGWVYFGSRRAFRELTGKRNKTDISKLVDEASKRRNIYMKLHLYETKENE
ncbi:MAG: nucleotidyltransferase family protein [Erysipelotrichaceae bacterium]|nr:nucleotidyltransferase family protein [Erysipelotrichaceae bacterium]